MAASLPGQMPYAPSPMGSGYDAVLNSALRQRRLAEMLQNQAFKTSDVGLNVPGAKMSVLNPIAQMLQAYLSGKMGKDADSAEASANAQRTQDFQDYLKNAPTATPDVPAMPIAQEDVAKPAAPPMLPSVAAFGAQGMPQNGPASPDLGGSASPLAASLVGGAPPTSPLLPPGADAGAPPLLPKPMDMAIPGAAPKLTTDAIPGKKPSPQDWLAYGAGMSKFGPAGEKIGAQITGDAAQNLLPKVMSPDMIAQLQMKHSEFQQTLAQRADDAKQRSEDRNATIEQRRQAAQDHNALMRELAADRAANKSQAEPGNMVEAGASVNGNTIVRNSKTGIAHEVVNGVPSPEPYGGPVTAKAAQEKGIAVAAKGEQGIKDMQSSLDAIEKDPALFGKRANLGALAPNAFGISQKVGGLSAAQLEQQANIASMTAETTHSLYGSAFSAGEQQRAKKFLIESTDSADQAKAKLKGRIKLEQDHYNELPASAKAAATERKGGGSSNIDDLIKKHGG